MEKISKTKVVKSKSSNNAISNTGNIESNQKSRSSAKIEQNILKKRGPYVVKDKSVSRNLRPPVAQTQPMSKPRPPKRKFVSKVLQILNKSSMGTQYPSQSEENMAKKPARPKSRMKTRKEKGNRSVSTSEDIEVNYGDKNKSNKRKLNYRDSEKCEFLTVDQEVVVLRSRKDIVQTPSENSYNVILSESYKWADEDLLKMQKKMSEIENYKETYSKNNLDNSESKESIIVIEDDTEEPQKLMEEAKIDHELIITDSIKTLTQIEREKEEKGLYKFFVNVLENSFNVYHVETDGERVPYNEENDTLSLEIDELVVKKLTINDKIEEMPRKYDNLVTKLSENEFYIQDDVRKTHTTDIIESNPSPKYSRHLLHEPSPNKKVKRSFPTYLYEKRKEPRKRRKQKEIRQKNRERAVKKEFLESLKQQLSKTITKQPNSLYDSLKLMAKNKRKSISFNDTRPHIDDFECENRSKMFWDEPDNFLNEIY